MSCGEPSRPLPHGGYKGKGISNMKKRRYLLRLSPQHLSGASTTPTTIVRATQPTVVGATQSTGMGPTQFTVVGPHSPLLWNPHSPLLPLFQQHIHLPQAQEVHLLLHLLSTEMHHRPLLAIYIYQFNSQIMMFHHYLLLVVI